MQMKSNPAAAQNASLSRRRFLVGGVAVPATLGLPVVIQAAPIVDNHDELSMLLDFCAELRVRISEIDDEIEAIALRADRPNGDLHISMLGLFGEAHCRQYYQFSIPRALTLDDAGTNVHVFFEEQIIFAERRARLNSDFAHWPAVKGRDYHKALSTLQKKAMGREKWDVESGYRSANEKTMRLLGERYRAEDRIFGMPVMSFRDLRLKLDLLSDEEWSLDEDDMRLVLNSIAEFAKCDGIPALVEAGAA